MKRILFTLLTVLSAFFMTFSAAFCEETETEEKVDPEKLLETVDDEVFVRAAFAQDFSESQGYVNEFPDPNTFHQYYIYDGVGTDVLMSMLPAEQTTRTTNKRLTLDQARKDEFHVTYSVKQTENMGGLCWLRFSNVSLMGKGRESGVLLYPGGNAYFFTPVDGEMTYEQIADLSELNPEKKTVKFDIIRLAGVTYFYADKEFLFSYEDGIKEAVSFESGAELSQGGTRVRCDFDNFSMRTK